MIEWEWAKSVVSLTFENQNLRLCLIVWKFCASKWMICVYLELVFHCLRMWWVMKRHKNPHGGQHKRCHLEMEEFLWEWNKLESPDLARTTELANKVSIFCFSNLEIFSETKMVRLFPRILAESFYNFFLKRQNYLWKFGLLRLSKKGIQMIKEWGV